MSALASLARSDAVDSIKRWFAPAGGGVRKESGLGEEVLVGGSVIEDRGAVFGVDALLHGYEPLVVWCCVVIWMRMALDARVESGELRWPETA